MNRYLLLFGLLAISSCEDRDVVSAGPMNVIDEEWSIPRDRVRDGGVGRDGIPSIDEPSFANADQQEVVLDHELITGIFVNGQAVAFPHKILDYHEVVNTDHGDESFALTFCPLTGTSLVFPRNIDGVTTTFGVSGLLFNSNLIIYDRDSESLWSQMMLQGVNGKHKNRQKEFVQVIETTWATWKEWYPGSLVLQAPNDRPRSYDEYAYGGYRTNHDLVLFPPKYDFTGYPRKERLLGIVTNNQMFHHRFSEFEFKEFKSRKIGEEEVLVFGSVEDNYMFAFGSETNTGKKIEVDNLFSNKEGGQLFQDIDGNIWSIFGVALEGPLKGESLKRVQNYIGYSFAMAAFYRDDFFDKNEF